MQAAKAGKLPQLIELADLKAEHHCHSTWSDGRNTIQQMAEAARQCGYKILAITDHSPSLGITQGVTIEGLKEQRAEIDTVQDQLGESNHLLQGSEVEIRADGSLDYPDEVLASIDIVFASLHVSLRQPREQVTQRLVNAIRNPHVDVIGHPTGRLIPDREGAGLDMDAVLKAAAESGVALEINANPMRLDLTDVKYAKEKQHRDKTIAKFPGVQMTIAKIAEKTEAARWLVYRLGYLAETLKDPRAFAREAALTKSFVTEAAVDVSRLAIAVHGSYGLMEDYAVSRIYRAYDHRGTGGRGHGPAAGDHGQPSVGIMPNCRWGGEERKKQNFFATEGTEDTEVLGKK